jgi:hypothetical protein
MLSLAEFQFTMAADLLDGGMRTARLLPGDPEMVKQALRVHRNTVLAGLANALRLGHPTVAWLTGEDFFDQAAIAFATQNPPHLPCLFDYGDGFAAFLEDYKPASAVPYIADVARFDRAIERCAIANQTIPILLPLDRETALELDGSLVTLSAEYPVERLRDACDGKDADSLEHLDMSPQARNYAVWRGDYGAVMRPLSMPAATFLSAALRGEAADAALAAALLHADPDEALALIRIEIFAAPFVRILSQRHGERT